MAKRKKSYKRRRKMGALNPGSPVVMIASIAAGYFLGNTINGAIDKMLPASMTAVPAAGASAGMMSYVPVVAEGGLGAFLLKGKGRKTLIKSGAGGILVGAALHRALKKFGVITGYQTVPVIGRRMNGYQSVPVIGGLPNSLTGLPQGDMLDFGMNTPAALRGYQINGNLGGYRPNGSRVLGRIGAINETDGRSYTSDYYAGGQPLGSGLITDGSGYLN